jgi:hypothetical protein
MLRCCTMCQCTFASHACQVASLIASELRASRSTAGSLVVLQVRTVVLARARVCACVRGNVVRACL